MKIQRDILATALYLAVEQLKKQEARYGPNFCSCQRFVMQEALEKLDNGERIEIV